QVFLGNTVSIESEFIHERIAPGALKRFGYLVAQIALLPPVEKNHSHDNERAQRYQGYLEISHLCLSRLLPVNNHREFAAASGHGLAMHLHGSFDINLNDTRNA